MGRQRKTSSSTSQINHNITPPQASKLASKRVLRGDGPYNALDRNTKPFRHGSTDRRRHTEQMTDDKKSDRDMEDAMFPRLTPIVVFLVTSILRVYYVIQPQNWWIVHPDEVYQSMEVAHIETFGYGFLPYEFTAPEAINGTTLYRQAELKAGMASLHSPLYPYFYVITHRLMASLGFVCSPFIFWRTMHAIVSSTLPLAVYRHVTSVSQSRDVACTASILVASSVHLNVLGTHTFLNSFMSPFIFVSLALVTDTLISNGPTLRDVSKSLLRSSRSSENTSKQPKTMSPNSSNSDGVLSNRINGGHSLEQTSGIYNVDINGNTHYGQEANQGKFQNCKPNGSICFPNEEACFKNNSLKKIIENSGSKLQCKSNRGFNRNVDDGQTNSSENDIVISLRLLVLQISKASLVGFLVGLAVYIQPGAILVYAAHFVVCFSTSNKRQYSVLGTSHVVLGSLLGFVVGIFADRIYYGPGVYSFVNYVRFYVFKELSVTKILYNLGNWEHLRDVFLADFGTGLSAFLAVIIAMHFIKLRNPSQPSVISKSKSRNTVSSTSSHAVMLQQLTVQYFIIFVFMIFASLVFSQQEIRFTHDVVVILFLFVAYAISAFVQEAQSLTSSKRNYLVVVYLSLFSCAQFYNFPTNKTNSGWIYQGTPGVQNINSCLHFISAQSDVAGVFLDSDVTLTGGLTLIHNDVIIMATSRNGFYEYGPQSRRNFSSNSVLYFPFFSDTFNKSVNEFNRASKYFDENNAGGVATSIFLEPNYNYLVLRLDRRFVEYGFHEVYRSGDRRVLKRLGDPESELKLKLASEKIPHVENSTVFLHEADVLLHMGQWQEAAQRLKYVINLDQSTKEAYPPLELAFSKLGQSQAARTVRSRCKQLFGTAHCDIPAALVNA